MTVLAITAVMGITGYLFATVLDSPYLVSVFSVFGVAILAGGAYAVIAGVFRENKKEREDIWEGAFWLLLFGFILVAVHIIGAVISAIHEAQITKPVLLALAVAFIVGDIICTAIKEKRKKFEPDLDELIDQIDDPVEDTNTTEEDEYE